MSTSKIRLIYLFAFMLAVACTTYAQDIGNREIKLQYEKVNGLITMSSDFGNHSIIPGYEYVNMINVSWAIPDEALVDLNSDKVVVFVSVWSNSDDIIFDAGNGRERKVEFSIYCYALEGKCNGGSLLNKNIKVFTTHKSIHEASDELIFVNATLVKSQDGIFDGISLIANSIATGLGIKKPENISANATFSLMANNQSVEVNSKKVSDAAQGIATTTKNSIDAGQNAAGNSGAPLQPGAIIGIIAILAITTAIFWKYKP